MLAVDQCSWRIALWTQFGKAGSAAPVSPDHSLDLERETNENNRQTTFEAKNNVGRRGEP
jgi:hypothetical protein